MKNLTLFILIFISRAYADGLELDESKLFELARTTIVPELEKIESVMLEAKGGYSKVKDQMGSEFYTGYSYAETDQKALIIFQPVFSPVHQYRAGVRKNFSHGVQADLSASVDNRSSTSGGSSYDSLHTTTYALNLNIDLWKDLFGKVTKKKLSSARLYKEQAEIQKNINSKVFMITLRRLYWSLVANTQKIKISEGLYDTAIRQVKDAKKRQASSVADSTEVAGYESQVASRQGRLLLLKYDREKIIKQLRDFIPEIASQDILLKPVSINETIFDVLACTVLIKTKKNVPLNYTQYDELTKILKEIQSNQEVLDNAYDSIDLKLATEFKQTGVGSEQVGTSGNFQGSYEDSTRDLEDGFSAGITLTIPMGKKIEGTSETLKKYNQKKLNAGIKNVQTNLMTTHRQVTRSIQYLEQVIQSQRNNSKSLGIRLRGMKKKYNQARIPVYQLIQDQDALLNSDLSIVDTQLAILNTLLDYFVVFSETPCKFNKQ